MKAKTEENRFWFSPINKRMAGTLSTRRPLAVSCWDRKDAWKEESERLTQVKGILTPLQLPTKNLLCAWSIAFLHTHPSKKS